MRGTLAGLQIPCRPWVAHRFHHQADSLQDIQTALEDVNDKKKITQNVNVLSGPDDGRACRFHAAVRRTRDFSDPLEKIIFTRLLQANITNECRDAREETVTGIRIITRL